MQCVKTERYQKLIDPSPFRPQTTIDMERVKTAARAAHAKVNNIDLRLEYKTAYRLEQGYTSLRLISYDVR